MFVDVASKKSNRGESNRIKISRIWEGGQVKLYGLEYESRECFFGSRGIKLKVVYEVNK